ncbi:MAG: glycosyl transferase family 2 [Flavipsychrobacter sp.]|jgi:glycosyltransferase involved in cell wall biosynthesis|nr:glycosyl transferase family 2 [Flavipsychrobacter sp.]
MKSHPQYSFLGVNDGSKDGTLQLLQTVANQYPDQFFVYDMPQNGGKAEAVRQGLLYAGKMPGFDYFGYWDADFSTPLEELDWFVYFSGGQLTHEMIMGTRVARLGAGVERKMLRHYLGRIFATVIANLLKVRIYDSQCGAKLIHSSQVTYLFDKPFVSRWFFDVEVLFRMLHKEGKNSKPRILEVPLRTWKEIGGSKLKLTDFIKAPYELWRIYSHYN